MTPEETHAMVSAALFPGASPEKRAEVLMKAGRIPVDAMPYVVAHIREAVRQAAFEEREKCIGDVAGAMSEQGTDDPHQALDWAVQAIRDRAKREGGQS